MSVSLSDIQAARERIAPYIIETPLIRLHNLEEILGCEVYVKLENMQRTNSFKLRGVMNSILQLTKEQLASGIVTSTSGNHGHAVAYAAKMLGINATVVVPDTAPPFKLQKIEEYGAESILTTVEKRFKLLGNLVTEYGYTRFPPSNDYSIMAGQGTVGLEILEQLPNVEHIFIPASSGGLLGGVATAVKESIDNVKVHGVEPENLPKFTASLKNGEITQVENKGTIADGLVSIIPRENNFKMVQKYVDDFYTVSERAIKKGQKLMLMEAKILTEISSSIAIGGILAGEIKVNPKSKVCFVITGGNLGFNQLDYIKDVEY